MTWTRGRFFDGRSSTPHDVEVQIGIDGVVRVTGAGAARDYRLAEVEISERIGNTPRTLRFPDGSACEITDNEAIDTALEQLDAVSPQHRVHQIESRWHYALLAGAALVVVAWATIQFGIPAAARHVAMAMPTATDHELGRQSLELLDSTSREMVDVKVVPDLLQVIALRARLEDLDGIPVININEPPLQGFNSLVKRAIDIGLSSAALAILSVPIAIIGCASAARTSTRRTQSPSESVGRARLGRASSNSKG